MRCFVVAALEILQVAGFLLTSASRGPSAIAEPLVILELRKLNCGCHVNGMFLGCLLYADDIVLLSSSTRGLQILAIVRYMP